MHTAITKAPWWQCLPPELRRKAVIRGGQAVWPRAAAEEVLKLLAVVRQKLLWAGAWVPLSNGFVIPMRYKYTYLRDSTARDDVADIVDWIHNFSWDRRDQALQVREPYFHFTVRPDRRDPHRPWPRGPRRRIWATSGSTNPATRSRSTRS